MTQVLPVVLHRRPARVAAVAAALVTTTALGAPAMSASGPDNLAAGADLAVAAAFVGFGVSLSLQRRKGDLSGPLMVATGVTWALGDLVSALALLHRGPLVQLLVAAPTGRPRTRLEWLVVVVAYVDGIVASVGRDPAVTVALGVVLAGVAVGRWASARGLPRRALVVPAAVALVLALGAVAGPAQSNAVLWCYEAILVGSAAAVWADRRWGGWAGAAMTTVVIDLGAASRGGSLAAALAGALGDPSLEVGYRVGEGYVDERGRALAVPGPGWERAVTLVEAGPDAAVLVHDPGTLRAQSLADSVARVVRLALDNVRLQAEIRARVNEVAASRARLMAARDLERRGLEARLHERVDRRLDDAADLLTGLEDCPEPLVAALPGELGRAREEVQRFAAGLHPQGLDAGGLRLALRALASGAPLPVEIIVDGGRFAPRIETAAWFVCAEALANVVKHAAAERAAIRAERSGPWLIVSVSDDGRGGADIAAGRGLRGLAARVEACGGRLEVVEQPGGGTRLCAWLPAEAPA